MDNFKKIIKFLHKVEKLKSIIRDHVKTSEGLGDTTAGHSWRLTLLVYLISKESKIKINCFKAIKIALIHDIVEAIAGDVSYLRIHLGKASINKKEEEERKAIKILKKLLPQKSGQEIYNLWNDYEKGYSKEAIFVKALDKIETLIQLTEAGSKTWHPLPEIIPTYGDKLVKELPILKKFLSLVKKDIKKEFKKRKWKWRKEWGK